MEYINVSENGEIYLSDYPFLEDRQPSFLEAKTVYLLMQKDIPVSRTSRLQWLLDHLNTIITPSQTLVSTIFNYLPLYVDSNCNKNIYMGIFRVINLLEIEIMVLSEIFLDLSIP